MQNGLAVEPPHYELQLPNYAPVDTRRSTRSSSRTRLQTEHMYELTGHGNSKKRPWIKMQIFSSGPSSNTLPMYWEGGSGIEGKVFLDLENGLGISDITMRVVGRLISSSDQYDACIFLDLSETMWHRGSTDSKAMIGSHEWPFKMTLPSLISWPNKTERFRLPPSLVEKNTRVTVQYEVYAFVKGDLSLKERVGINFVFLPESSPGPMSPLREVALHQKTVIPGPRADPSGWVTQEPLLISGRLGTKHEYGRKVTVKLILSLANPLSYTRGTSIPLHAQIETPDEETMAQFEYSSALHIQLRRRIFYKDDSETLFDEAVWSGTDGYPSSGERSFYGAIPLLSSLKTSYQSTTFSLSYSVVVFVPRAARFTAKYKDSIVAEFPVEICSLHAKSHPAHSRLPQYASHGMDLSGCEKI